MIGIRINLQINTVDRNVFVSLKSSRRGSVFRLIENYSNRKFFEIFRLDPQTIAIIVERDICRSTKVELSKSEIKNSISMNYSVWEGRLHTVETRRVWRNCSTFPRERENIRRANSKECECWSIQLTEVTSSSRPNNQYFFSRFGIDTMTILLFSFLLTFFSIVIRSFFFSITWNIVYRWMKFCEKLYG